MYLIDAGSLALADDAMKNERGAMKDQTKADVKADKKAQKRK